MVKKIIKHFYSKKMNLENVTFAAKKQIELPKTVANKIQKNTQILLIDFNQYLTTYIAKKQNILHTLKATSHHIYFFLFFSIFCVITICRMVGFFLAFQYYFDCD